MKKSSISLKRVFLATCAAAIVIGLLGYGGYRYWELRTDNMVLKKESAALEQSLAAAKLDLARAQNRGNVLDQALQAEQNKNSAFESQIKTISGTVGALQKLSATDPHLLKKYSKVYFLSENYAPAQLSSINSEYIFDKSRPQLIHSSVLPYLQQMLEAADQAGIKLQVVSAYRSFYEQSSVKNSYSVLYGAGTANQFSADQGYSEHQLGTAVDLTTPEIKGVFLEFEKSTAYTWLNENAYKFGFVLSYPKDNSYYQFEPWHWRFVGIALATDLHDKNEYFYNLSQYDIDKYLISIFN